MEQLKNNNTKLKFLNDESLEIGGEKTLYMYGIHEGINVKQIKSLIYYKST